MPWPKLNTCRSRRDEGCARSKARWTTCSVSQAPTPGLAERVKELLPNALDVTVDHPRDAGQAQTERGKAAGSSPPQLFAAYYEYRHRTPPPPELQQRFDAVHEEAAK